MKKRRVIKCFTCGGLYSEDLMENIFIDGMEVPVCPKCIIDLDIGEEKMLAQAGIPYTKPVKGQEGSSE